ncbi:MAG TPA: response regulator [Candidatus Dormibacteraeota bacterium]|nr:response regulator [Candidatus Dormibacteraeota bacterium]
MNQTTILHVEDDSNDVLLFEHACRKAGVDCTIRTVEDGDDAMDYLRGKGAFCDRNRYPMPQLILLDLKMPRLNGFEVLELLRSEEQFRSIPIIVLSSSNHAADVRRAYALGANSYLMKPVAFEALVEIVRSLNEYWIGLNVLAEV